MGTKKKQKPENGKRLVLTGGHAGSTGYAVIQELQRRFGKALDISWIGAKYAMEGKSDETFEYRMLPKLNVSFYPIYTGRIQRKISRRTILSLMKIPLGFVHAFYLLLITKPDLVVSFGGYSAYPVVMVSWVLGIKVISHEQTSTVGLVTKRTARFVDCIALARASSKKYLPIDKCVVVGNPIHAELLSSKKFRKLGSPPTIFVSGGSRGSVPINDVIIGSLNELLKKYRVVHQTGSVDFDRMSNIKTKLKANLRKRYEIYDLIQPAIWDRLLSEADIVVSRAGANSVSAIIYLKTPAILIPIPKTHRDEQIKNAEYAKKFGIAEVIDQVDLTPDFLLKTIENIIQNWDKIVRKVENKESPDINASRKFVDLIATYIK